MTNSKLDRAVAEARRFLAVATDYQNAIQNDQNAVDRAKKADPCRSHYTRDFPVKSGATRRASMDLTRATDNIQNGEGVEAIDQAPREITYNPVYGMTYHGADPTRGYVYTRHSLAREPATADVERAREIAASEMDEKGWRVDAVRIRQGRWDGHPSMIAALSRAAPSSEPAIAEGERAKSIDVTAMVSEALGDHQVGNRPALKNRLIADIRDALAQSSTPPASKGVEALRNAFCPKAFGETVLRAMNGRTCREVAPEAGISKATLNRVTLGNMPDLPTYFSLCRWLSVPAGILVLDGPKFSKLHALQHGVDTAAKPKIGGSIIGWAAEEIATLRAMLAASPTPSNDTLQGRGEVEP